MGKAQTCGDKTTCYKKPVVNEEIKEEIRKYLETNENGNTTLQNLWDAAKRVLRVKFTEIQAFLKKQEKSQTT